MKKTKERGALDIRTEYDGESMWVWASAQKEWERRESGSARENQMRQNQSFKTSPKLIEVTSWTFIKISPS